MQSYQRFQHVGHTAFNISGTNGSRSFSQVKAGTHLPSPTGSYTPAHTAKHGAFRMGGGITTLGAFRTFTNIPGPGIRTAYFAAFGSWSGVLSKNAESLGTAMRLCASLFRGVAAPLGCVIFFRFCQNYGLYALFQILLSVLQTFQLVLFLCKLRLGSFLVGSELFKGFRFCHCA